MHIFKREKERKIEKKKFLKKENHPLPDRKRERKKKSRKWPTTSCWTKGQLALRGLMCEEESGPTCSTSFLVMPVSSITPRWYSCLTRARVQDLATSFLLDPCSRLITSGKHHNHRHHHHHHHQKALDLPVKLHSYPHLWS